MHELDCAVCGCAAYGNVWAIVQVKGWFKERLGGMGIDIDTDVAMYAASFVVSCLHLASVLKSIANSEFLLLSFLHTLTIPNTCMLLVITIILRQACFRFPIAIMIAGPHGNHGRWCRYALVPRRSHTGIPITSGGSTKRRKTLALPLRNRPDSGIGHRHWPRIGSL